MPGGLNIGSLFVALGFDVDDKKLKEFNEQFKSGVDDVQRYSDKIRDFSSGTLTSATNMKNFADQTGYSTRNLQEWTKAAQAMNPALSSIEASATYSHLADQIALMQQGEGLAGVFSRLGIDYGGISDPASLLQMIHDNKAKIIKDQGLPMWTSILKQAGINPNFENVLDATDQQRRDTAASYIVPQEEQDKAAGLNDRTNRFMMHVGPAISKIITKITDGMVLGWTDSSTLFTKGRLPDNDEYKAALDKFYGVKNSKLHWIDDDNKPVKTEPVSPAGGNAQSDTIRFFMQNGLSFRKAAGIAAGGAGGESEFNPNAIGDKGTAFGAYQWHADRRNALLRSTGIDVANSTLADQNRAALAEMQQMGLWDRIKAAPDNERIVAAMVTKLFERPAFADVKAEDRADRAQQIVREGGVQMTNTFNIDGATNPKDTALVIADKLQQQFSLTGSTLNLGPTY